MPKNVFPFNRRHPPDVFMRWKHHVEVKHLLLLSTFSSAGLHGPQTCCSGSAAALSSAALLAVAPAVILPPLTCVCVCACVSSCTHTQLMKSKCPAAVVTVVRLSRCRHSEATTRPEQSWWKHVWEQQINWSPWEFFFPQQFMTSATIHKTLSRPSFHFYNWCSAQTTFKCTALLYLFFYYPPTCAPIPPPVFQLFNRRHRPPLPFMPAPLFLNPFFPFTGQLSSQKIPDQNPSSPMWCVELQANICAVLFFFHKGNSRK